MSADDDDDDDQRQCCERNGTQQLHPVLNKRDGTSIQLRKHILSANAREIEAGLVRVEASVNNLDAVMAAGFVITATAIYWIPKQERAELRAEAKEEMEKLRAEARADKAEAKVDSERLRVAMERNMSIMFTITTSISVITLLMSKR